MTRVPDRRSATPVPRRGRWATAGAIAASALVVAACANGQRAQTAYETPVLDGVGTQVGSIDIRAAKALAPAGDSYAQGSDLPISFFLVNNGTSTDRLVGVTSSIASGSQLLPAGSSVTGAESSPDQLPSTAVPTSSQPDVQGSSQPGTVQSPGARNSNQPAPSTPGTGSAAVSGTSGSTASVSAASSSGTSGASGSSTPTSGASASSSTAPLTSLSVPANQSVSVSTGSTAPVLELTGLKQQLFPSQSFSLTLQFAEAGSVSFQIAVALPTDNGSTTPSVTVSPTSGA